jgi:hypothetical protein
MESNDVEFVLYDFMCCQLSEATRNDKQKSKQKQKRNGTDEENKKSK